MGNLCGTLHLMDINLVVFNGTNQFGSYYVYHINPILGYLVQYLVNTTLVYN